MEQNPFAQSLAAALNTSVEDLTSLVKEGEDGYKSDADKIILNKITEHLNAQKDKFKAQYDESKDNLVNKAVKETSERFTSALKSKFGINGEFDKAEEAVAAAAKKLEELSGADVDEKKVLSHPKYLELQSRLADEVQKVKQSTEEEWSNKYNGLQQEIESRELRSTISQVADEFWTKQQIIDVPDDVKTNWKKEFQERIIRQAKFKKLEDGRVIPVNEEGRALENDLGHSISTEDIVRKSFEGYVPVKQSSDRTSTGGKGGKGGAGYTGAMPKTSEDAIKMIQDRSIDPKQRLEIQEYAAKNGLV